MQRKVVLLLVINVLGVAASVSVIVVGVMLSINTENSCVKVATWPTLIVGILMLPINILGFITAFRWGDRRLAGLPAAYLFFMFAAFIVLLVFIIFIFVSFVRGSGGEKATSRSYMEYHFQSYSGWLDHRVRGPFKWFRIGACLAGKNLCSTMNETYTTPPDFFKAELNPIESGCCKPPTECGYTFVSPTEWIDPIAPDQDEDCRRWDVDKLCFGCDSCRAGLLERLRTLWRKMGVLLLIPLFLWFVVMAVAACVVGHESKTEKLFSDHKDGGETYYR